MRQILPIILVSTWFVQNPVLDARDTDLVVSAAWDDQSETRVASKTDCPKRLFEISPTVRSPGNLLHTSCISARESDEPREHLAGWVNR